MGLAQTDGIVLGLDVVLDPVVPTDGILDGIEADADQLDVQIILARGLPDLAPHIHASERELSISAETNLPFAGGRTDLAERIHTQRARTDVEADLATELRIAASQLRKGPNLHILRRLQRQASSIVVITDQP